MSPRLAYFLRRLLLIPPTFIGITFACFFICQIAPGGPIEQYLNRLRGGQISGQSESSQGVSEEQLQAIRERFGYDKPILTRYWNWLSKSALGLNVYSYKYSNKKVWELLLERLPVSLSFGLCGFFLTYLVCIPLGISKALRHGSWWDTWTSVVIFGLYAAPAFAFGMLLKFLLCGSADFSLDIFPIGGFRSANFEDLSLLGKIKDQAWHMVLPVICYMLDSFAFLTLLQKNSLLEQINQDYMRAVMARGLSRAQAVWRHALRNALIPVATGIGGIFTIFLASSALIEKVFNIPGIGLLSLDSILSRDYMLFMGILSVSAILGMIGRLFSDFCYVLIDPRIDFGGN